MTPGLEYGAGTMPISFFIPAGNDGKGMIIKPPVVDGEPAVPEFRSRPGRKGVVITGHPADTVRSIAIFHFRDAQPVITRVGKSRLPVDRRLRTHRRVLTPTPARFR